ncbi:MAG TPA: hypothetical protein VJN70_12905, partial [Gemmatimonadaceae bacterium]|nr:hypothetical protein [Gemmatimonadaceae bacterium]
MHIRFARLPQIALSLSLVACRDGTAPIGRPGHPTGTVSDAFTGFPGSLNGVQLTPANEIILTESDQNLLVRVDAHSGSRASIGVATDPLDVVVNRAGTLAFINCFT